MAIEHITGIDNRIADLQRKLAAREGKKEYIENVKALKAEINRLQVLREVGSPVASEGSDEVST